MKKVSVEIDDKLYDKLCSLCYEGRYSSPEDALLTITTNVVESNWSCMHAKGESHD